MLGLMLSTPGSSLKSGDGLCARQYGDEGEQGRARAGKDDDGHKPSDNETKS